MQNGLPDRILRTTLIDHPGTRMLDYAQTKLRLCGRANERSGLRDQNINSL